MLIKKFLFIFDVLYISVNSYLIPPLNSFSKELTFFDKHITLSSSYNIVTESDSFVYAVCDTQEKTFKENRCNVTIETPAFENATYKEMCSIHLVSNNRNFEVLTKFRLHHFGDNKVLLSWLIKDPEFHTKVAKIRIIHWLNCEFHDVSVPADNINNIIAYDNTFDVVISNKTTCSSDYCRITYDVNGKKVSGPTLLASNIKISTLESIVPVLSRSSVKGFYLLVTDSKNTDVLHVDHNGKGIELIKTKGYNNVKISNAHGNLTVCWVRQTFNVTCWQYDGKTNKKMETIIRYSNNPELQFTRWIHPYNLADHGLLLVSGRVNVYNQPNFENFSITKIQPNGLYERPLEIGGLDFKCTSIHQFFINVSENNEDEICVHFICDRADFDKQGVRNTLKFSTKCLSKKHVSITKNRTLRYN